MSLRLRTFLRVIRFCPGSWCDFERLSLALRGIGAYPHGKARGLNGKFVLVVPEREGFGAQFELDFLLLARRKRNALKAAQRANRQRDTGSLQAHVTLHGFLARKGSGPTLRGQLTGSLPLGFASPNNVRTSAGPA